MDWLSIFSAGIAGPVAAVVATLGVRNNKERRTFYIVAMVIMFFGLQALSEKTILPRIRERQMDRELRQLPFYGDIAEVDPQTYAQIQTVIADSLRQNEGVDAIAGKITPIITATVPKYVATASDESVLGFVDAVIEQTESLQQVSPGDCYYYLFPGPGAPALPHVNDVAKNQMLASMGRVVHSAVHSPQPPPDAAKAQALLLPITDQMKTDFGRDLVLMIQKPTDTDGRSKVCAMTIALYKGVRELPPGDSSLLLRYLLSAQKSSAAGK